MFSTWTSSDIVNSVVGAIAFLPLMQKFRSSTFALVGLSALFVSSLFYFTGFSGVVKYWLIPFVGYHVLVSATRFILSLIGYYCCFCIVLFHSFTPLLNLNFNFNFFADVPFQ